jgi:hypothetical protein
MRYDGYHDCPVPPSWTPTRPPDPPQSRLRERRADPPETTGGDRGIGRREEGE